MLKRPKTRENKRGKKRAKHTNLIGRTPRKARRAAREGEQQNESNRDENLKYCSS